MFYQIITYLHFYFIRTPPLTHTHHQSFILSFYFEHICLLLLFEFCVLLLWIWQNSYLSWSKVMALCESIFFVDCLYLVALASWLGLECSQVWSPDPGWSLGSAVPEVTLGSWTGEAWSRTVPGKCCTWGWLSKVAEGGVGTGWEGSPWGMLGQKQVGGVTGASVGQAKGNPGAPKQWLVLDSISAPRKGYSSSLPVWQKLQN